VATRAKRFEYTIALDRNGRLEAEDGVRLELPEDWKPEHLVLAGLVRCTLTSLEYHARRAAVAVTASGDAWGAVTRREEDDRYAFVEVECQLDVELEPRVTGADLAELIGKAERDCFVSASLALPPRYRWRVNGEELE
jgi:organic hydroperoxide reductase OsmC/OhrA